MLTRRSLALFLLAVGILASGCHSTGPRPIPNDPSCPPCRKVLGDFEGGAECPVESWSPSLRRGPFDFLVFEGGGVKGIAYAGALKVLEEQGLTADVEAVAGASAGSIVALAIALGYDAEEVQKILLQLQFTDFEDSHFPFTVVRLFEEYGLYPGDYALCFLNCLVSSKGLDQNTTFAELHELHEGDPRTFKDLYAVATDVRAHKAVTFSHETHPDLPISHAARMSMSFPYFFAATELTGRIFVDGGVVNNYPMSVFDGKAPERVLGFHLGTGPSEGPPIEDLVGYTKEMFTTLLDVQTDAFCQSPRDVERSVIINTLGIPTLDFGLSRAQKCDLVRSGAAATRAWLEEPEPSGVCPPWLLEQLRREGDR